MQKTALVLLLAALPFTSCKCRQNFTGLTASLVASPPQAAFGPQAENSSKTIKIVVTNQGDAPVNITAVPAISNGPFTAYFPLADGGVNPLPIFLDVAEATNMSVTYSPTGEETDTATLTVQNDSDVPLSVPLSGTGQDPCFEITCDAGVPGIGSNQGGCYGTCQAGKCVYAGSCSERSLCLSNGTCNPSTGACQGTSDCEQPGAATCTGNVLNGDVAPGACNPGPGTCLYNTQTVTCDCACVQTATTAACTYQWEPVQGLPTGQAASVWSAGTTAGDLWLSVVTGSAAGYNPNTVYQQVNGAWQQVGMVANAENPLCAGPGCGLELVGTSDSDVYGAIDCLTMQGGVCSNGGAWHYSGSAAADEGFPTNVPDDFPLTTIVDIGGTGFALNSDASNVGPELVSNAGGPWTVILGTDWGCEISGSLWGSAANDIWIGWGCNNKTNSGQIAHFNGTGLDTAAPNAPYPLPAGEYAAGMWGTSDTDIWAVGTHRWHNDGTSWTEDAVAPPGGNADQAVWGNGTDYFAGGGYIALYHLTQAAGAVTTDWTEECVQPGYSDPSVYSFTSDGTNFYATTSAISGPGLVQRCPGGVCP